MNNFDDILESSAARNNRNDQPFDKDAWAEKKQAERQAVFEMADAATAEVCADGEKFRAYAVPFAEARPVIEYEKIQF